MGDFCNIELYLWIFRGPNLETLLYVMAQRIWIQARLCLFGV